jgi:hypothetical protein
MAKVKKRRCFSRSRKTGSRCYKIKNYSNIKKRSNKRSRRKTDDRGCSLQTSPKYKKRNSPPYPANQCCGKLMKGNDGEMYISKYMQGAGHCRWIKA